MNLLKKLFKKQPKKQTVTFKTSKIGFIGQTKTLDVLSEQEVDKKIEQAIAQLPPGGGGPPFDPTPINQEIANLKQKDIQLENRITTLDNNNAKKNQNNTFTGTQTFEFAKVSRVLGTDPKDIINWSVFDTRATSIENRVRVLEQNPPGGGPPFDPAPLQQEIASLKQTVNAIKGTVQDHDRVLQEFIRETNEKFQRTKIPRTIFNAESSLTSISSGDIESYSVGNGVWNFKITKSKTVTFSGSAIYNALASRIEANNNETIKVRVSSIVSAFVVDNGNFRLPVGTVETTVNGTYPFELKKNSGNISINIKNARGIATGDPKTVLRNIMCLCSFYRVLS